MTSSGFDAKEYELFGERRLHFSHRCGIEYELVGVETDPRMPHSKGPVPTEHGIHGTHGICVSVLDLGLSADFMNEGWGGQMTMEDGDNVRFEVGKGGSGAIVDFVAEPRRNQAGWMYGEGIIHHTAFQVTDLEVQDSVKH